MPPLLEEGGILPWITAVSYTQLDVYKRQVSSLAQAAGEAALRESAYVEAVRRLIKKERPWLKAELEKLGLEVFPSMANYLFVRNPWE